MAEPGPSSPCLNICSLDEQGICRGCFRSLQEIAGWTSMDAGEQWAVVRAADRRRREAREPRKER